MTRLFRFPRAHDAVGILTWPDRIIGHVSATVLDRFIR